MTDSAHHTPAPAPQAGEPGTVAVTPADSRAAATYHAEPSAEIPKLRVSNLSVTYLDRHGVGLEAVRDVSFDIRHRVGAAERLVFLAPSGCGKPPLWKTIARPPVPTAAERLVPAAPWRRVGAARGRVIQAYHS